jgi:hypothetical protein
MGNNLKLFKVLKFHLGVLVILAATNCTLAFASDSSNPPAISATFAVGQDTLFVASPTPSIDNASIFRFTGPSALAGVARPAATITGNITYLASPVIALDKSADRLFALVTMGRGSGAILVFDHVSLRAGNVPPTWVIAGRATSLQSSGVFAVDATRNRIYAGAAREADGQVDILVFNNAAAASGNVPPSAVLKFGSAKIRPTDMALDEVNDRLFIADTTNEIQVFDHASALTSGSMVPNRTFSGPNTGISRAMYHIALDSAGRLLVSAGGVSVDIYANAATAIGNITPVARIMGSNLGSPEALTVYTGPGASAGGDLYISVESGKVLVFTNIDKANGNVVPARTFSINTANELGLTVNAR